MCFRSIQTVGVCVLVFFAGPALAESSISDGQSAIGVADIRSELLAIPPEIRARIVADKPALTRFVGGILQDERVAAAARESGLVDQLEVKSKAKKSYRDLLVNQYLAEQAERASRKGPDFKALAKERFETNRDAFVQSEAARVAHILVRVDVEDERLGEAEMRPKAEGLLARAKGGEDFGSLAKEFSDDKGSASRGGELSGWVEKDKTVPPFERAAFALKPGEISGLVRTRYGFHIIKQLEYRKAAPQKFSEVEAQLVAKLKADYQTEQRNEFAKRFAGTQPIVIDDATFEAIKAK